MQPTWVRDNADGVHFTLPNECMHVLIAFLCSTCLMRTCIASQPTWVRDVADALHVMLKRPETAGKTFYLAGPETLWWVVCSIACVSVCVCVCVRLRCCVYACALYTCTALLLWGRGTRCGECLRVYVWGGCGCRCVFECGCDVYVYAKECFVW